MLLKKVFNLKIVLLAVLLGLFPPAYFGNLHILALELFLRVLKYAAYVLILLIFVEDLRKNLKKQFNIFLLVLVFELFFSTLISKDALILNWYRQIVYRMVLCFFIGEVMTIAPYKGIQCLYWYFSLITMINTISVFLFPNAMYQNVRGNWVCWFLGEDNVGYAYYIVASMLAMIYNCYITKRVTVMGCWVWISSFVFVFHNNIATGIICQILWAVLIICFLLKWFRKLLNAKYAVCIFIGGFFFLVLGRQLILEPITMALGRSITLTGRTGIWDKVLAGVSDRPFFGYGVYSGEQFNRLFHLSIYGAHNHFLEVLFWGGIVGAVLFIGLIYSACRIEKEYRRSWYYLFMTIGLIVFSVRQLVESSGTELFYLCLAITAYSKEFIQRMKDCKLSSKRIIRPLPRVRFRFRRDGA